jgi:hypothetical protein
VLAPVLVEFSTFDFPSTWIVAEACLLVVAHVFMCWVGISSVEDAHCHVLVFPVPQDFVILCAFLLWVFPVTGKP